MDEIVPRLKAALDRQLQGRRRDLDAGAGRVGWKLGVGDEERIGDGPVIGYLTTATVLDAGSTYSVGRDGDPRADAEVAVEIGPGGAIAGYRAALELVDLSGTDDPVEIVAANVFHRAVAFGPRHANLRAPSGRVLVNGTAAACSPAEADYESLVARTGELLAAMGERLESGDLLITGAIVQVPIASGDRVIAEVEPLGSVRLDLV
jgi:2-keto-4-pentenoate hydratase